MIWPFPGNTSITTKWGAPRPISNPGEHVHGAIDIKLKIGSPIVSPERGELYKYFSIRNKDGVYWPPGEMQDFPFRNYFYDMFGGVFVLKGSSGITHVFAHIYMNQLYNKEDHEWEYIEQRADSRFPIFAFLSGPFEIYEGFAIGEAGNSGFSTGPHCHYEQHHGFIWNKHGDRPDPEKTYWANYK